MRKITLKRIVLSNWKSLNIDVTFNDSGSTRISGRNGIGKSSLQSAWNWLLTGYTNANAPKNHELYDNRYELSHETPVASVKAWVSIDGIDYTIEKTAQAKFTRKRGSSEYIKDSSDSYKVLVDDIEISATAFSEWVESNFCDIVMLEYALDGTFFTTLAENDKKNARKVLEMLVGEISADDFTGDYSLINSDFAKGYSVDQIIEKTKHQIKPLKDRFEKIPAIIEAKEKSLAELEQEDYDAIKAEIEEKKKSILDIDDAILGRAEAIKPILGQRDAIYEIINSKTLKLNECRNTYLGQHKSAVDALKCEIDRINIENSIKRTRNESAYAELDKNVRELEAVKAELKSANEYRIVLLQRKDEIKSRVFTGEKCHYCNQELPVHMQEELQAQFNKQKNEDLDFVVSSGKSVREKIDMLSAKADELTDIIAKGVQLEELVSTAELEQKLVEKSKSIVPFEATPEYARLTKEIADIESTLPMIPTNDNTALTNTKKVLIDALETLNQRYGLKYKADEHKCEIDALKCELRSIANDIAHLEGVLAKCQEYMEERADIVSNRINDKLDYCKIQMWQMQKNGELAPSCTITDNSGVKYSTLNNSNRIKTCIALQQLFCKHYDIQLPVFVDEASVFSTNNKPVINGQSIFLYASDDNALVVK